MLGGKAPGMVWKEWSECWADRHSSADYIAVMDSDVVLTTFGIPQLLFDQAADGRLRPVIWGHAHEHYFPCTVEMLGLQQPLDFMDSFPLTVHRKDFAHARSKVVARFGQSRQALLGGAATGSAAFDHAFLEYVRAVHSRSVELGAGGECPSFHAMMGAILWNYRRDEYEWYIRHGQLAKVPLQFTCPRLRVSYHVPYWSHELTDHYPVPSLKPHWQNPDPFGALAYSARALALILAGLCEVPWRRALVWLGKHRLAFAMHVNSTTKLGSRAFEDVQRDLCTHGTQLVRGVSDPFQRFLSWRFPVVPVDDLEAAYCGGRRPSMLLREYRRLMGALAFVPDIGPEAEEPGN